MPLEHTETHTLAQPAGTDRTNPFESRINSFQKLMPFKIRDILLVSSFYDNYLFEEDGRLYELIREEAEVLNLSHPPDITHVTSAADALELLAMGNHFDLIISTLHIEDGHVVRFARMVREAGYNIPIVLLAYDNREKKEIVANFDTSVFERIFIWQGDYRLLIAIIKDVEDRLNVENDTRVVGVQSIILVEDNVKFYSSYLPIIYTEILRQSQRLITEAVNMTHKLLRMKARPKILLCTTYEEAWEYFSRYEEFILGVISDINFLHNGLKDPEGGIRFAMQVRARHRDIPILLQSSNVEFESRVRSLGFSFLQKGSPTLLQDLRRFVLDNLGFGDFIFRMPDGTEVGRASNLNQLEEQLHVLPEESIVYHAERNHFSNWLKARTEFELAHSLRPRTVAEFASVADLREELITSLRRYRESQQRGVISEFTRETFDLQNSFARIGSGSLGGKARGLGFLNTLINAYDVEEHFPGVRITVPSAVVLATDVFDRFLEGNGISLVSLENATDEEVARRFLDASYFPPDVLDKLRDLLDICHLPLAVRSSSLLEDSQYQPFAGVYQTYMIANNSPDDKLRLKELLESIKLVYASTVMEGARDYMKATSYRLEEEKMAVVIQRLVGSHHDGRFYPDFAGVARSYNFYPVAPQKSTDGIAMVALGLGRTVVDGGNAVRFCPKYPRHLIQFFSTEETVRNAQQEFFALDMDASLQYNGQQTPDQFVRQYDLRAAEEDGTLFGVGSTYSQEDAAVYDGIARPGRRIVTLAPVLKHRIFPLPEILDLILDMGTWGMGTPVEIEFAVNMSVPHNEPKEFALLQVRPLVLSYEMEELDVDAVPPEKAIVQSEHVLGNGAINDIHDAVVVDVHSFERARSREVAHQVAALNRKLIDQKRPYVLIGVGRWGSNDSWLGIPVTWDQISGAAVIVETGFKDMHVTPSQGSHFFQNITSFRIGYFTIDSFTQGFIDWDWLRAQPALEEDPFVRHLRFEKPISVKINGHKHKGVILKPEDSPP